MDKLMGLYLAYGLVAVVIIISLIMLSTGRLQKPSQLKHIKS
jgi:hypothetical protein